MTKTERQSVAELFRAIGPGAFGSQGEYLAFRESVDEYGPDPDAAADEADEAKADKK